MLLRRVGRSGSAARRSTSGATPLRSTDSPHDAHSGMSPVRVRGPRLLGRIKSVCDSEQRSSNDMTNKRRRRTPEQIIKRIRRLWRDEGLRVPCKRRKKRLCGIGTHVGAMSPIRPTLPRRVPQRPSLRQPPRSPRAHRGLADRLQHQPAPLRPRRPQPCRVRRRVDHQPTPTRIATGPITGPPGEWR
jgi:hypothetical protein